MKVPCLKTDNSMQCWGGGGGGCSVCSKTCDDVKLNILNSFWPIYNSSLGRGKESMEE